MVSVDVQICLAWLRLIKENLTHDFVPFSQSKQTIFTLLISIFWFRLAMTHSPSIRITKI
jgi:hypothetical protein